MCMGGMRTEDSASTVARSIRPTSNASDRKSKTTSQNTIVSNPVCLVCVQNACMCGGGGGGGGVRKDKPPCTRYATPRSHHPHRCGDLPANTAPRYRFPSFPSTTHDRPSPTCPSKLSRDGENPLCRIDVISFCSRARGSACFDNQSALEVPVVVVGCRLVVVDGVERFRQHKTKAMEDAVLCWWCQHEATHVCSVFLSPPVTCNVTQQ
jgi:hypothetical protein